MKTYAPQDLRCSSEHALLILHCHAHGHGKTPSTTRCIMKVAVSSISYSSPVCVRNAKSWIATNLQLHWTGHTRYLYPWSDQEKTLNIWFLPPPARVPNLTSSANKIVNFFWPMNLAPNSQLFLDPPEPPFGIATREQICFKWTTNSHAAWPALQFMHWRTTTSFRIDLPIGPLVDRSASLTNCISEACMFEAMSKRCLEATDSDWCLGVADEGRQW